MHRIELTSDFLQRKLIVSELFQTYYRIMCKTVFSILKDEIISEDIVQNIFLRLIEDRKELVLEYPQAYLKRIAINSAIDHIRKSSTVKWVEDDLEHFSHIKVEPDESSENESLLIQINKAIDELPEKCRLVFILKRKEGLTNKEIAEELNISIKTVENHITIAFRYLRDKLDPILFLILLFLMKS